MNACKSLFLAAVATLALALPATAQSESEFRELARPLTACIELGDALTLALPANIQYFGGPIQTRNECQEFPAGLKVRVIKRERPMARPGVNPSYWSTPICLRTIGQHLVVGSARDPNECWWAIVQE